MTEPVYGIARTVAPRVRQHLEDRRGAAPDDVRATMAPEPDVDTIAAIVDAGFWASVRREEDQSPRTSLAFLPPALSAPALLLERPIGLDPESLTRLALAVERPGIHLGVWPADGQLAMWGATRTLPPFCFVLEVVAPGLLVVKHSRGRQAGKFANVAVLDGDRIKILDERTCGRPDTPALIRSLLDLSAFPSPGGPGDALVRLTLSMRAHGHGGTLLVVPAGDEAWRESLVAPIRYALAPPFARLADLLAVPPPDRLQAGWADALDRAIDGVAGLTAVDGATVITDRYEVLAFGATIGRRGQGPQVVEVTLSEPIEGNLPRRVPVVQLGGTRHQWAAQFAHDQRDAIALVAAKEGHTTLFTWSRETAMVQAHRIETLLL